MSPLHLIDANVLITANEDYYGLEQVPQFWEWLVARAEEGVLKMPYEIFEEISVSTGALKDWITGEDVKDKLILDESVDGDIVKHVVDNGYAPDLNEADFEKIGRDPFLVAYGLAAGNRIIVTKEVSAPSKQRANRKLPDVCDTMGVKWMKDFHLFKGYGFTTK